MKKTGGIGVVAAALVLACAATGVSGQTAQLDHPFGWEVHRKANNQLNANFLWNLIHKLIRRQASYPGWLDNALPFEEVDWTDPGLDIYPIDPGTRIVVEMGAIDPAFSMRDPNDLAIVYPTGSQMFIGVGGTQFMTYPWWYLDSTDPAFDPSHEIWAVQFRLVDLTGTHDPSDWFDPAFRARPWVPAPGGVALWSIVAVAIGCTRRRRG